MCERHIDKCKICGRIVFVFLDKCDECWKINKETTNEKVS